MIVALAFRSDYTHCLPVLVYLSSTTTHLRITNRGVITMADSKKLDEEQGAHDTVVALDEAPAAVLEEGSLDPVYEAKARILNKAVQDIGMGKYQWQVNCFQKSHVV